MFRIVKRVTRRTVRKTVRKGTKAAVKATKSAARGSVKTVESPTERQPLTFTRPRWASHPVSF